MITVYKRNSALIYDDVFLKAVDLPHELYTFGAGDKIIINYEKLSMKIVKVMGRRISLEQLII